MAKTVILLLDLAALIIGTLIMWHTYQKDLSNVQAITDFLLKRIFVLTLVIGALNGVGLIIKYVFEKEPAAKEDLKQLATKQDVAGMERRLLSCFGNKLTNPPVEEVKSEIERELETAFDKQSKRALEHYQEAYQAYQNNRYEEAIHRLERAIEIVKTPSFFLSLGNINPATKYINQAA